MKAIWKEAIMDEISVDYQGIIANAAEGLFITTVEGKYLMVNNALAEIYGYDSVNDLMSSIINIGEQLYVDKSMREVFVTLMSENDRLVNFEAEIYTRDGERKWIRENVRAVKNEDGVVQYYEGFVSDITELKHNKQIIRSKNIELSELNKNLEEKVEERTAELEQQKLVVHDQNERLSKLLKEVIKTKITRQATMIAIAITLILFIVTEVLVEPIIEGNYKNDFYISLGLKALIALLIKPIEMLVETILLRTRSKKLIANKKVS